MPTSDFNTPTEQPAESARRSGVKDTAMHAAEEAGEKAREAAGRAKSGAMDTVDRAKEEAGSKLREGKDQLSNRIDSVARAFERVGEQLRDEGQPKLAEYADRLAGQVRNISGYARDRDPDTMLEDFENLARRQPMAFLTGAFAAGMLGARFLKSSERRRHPERYQPGLPTTTRQPEPLLTPSGSYGTGAPAGGYGGPGAATYPPGGPHV